MPSPSPVSSDLVVWGSGSEKFAADPIATTDLSYSDWLALGAHFFDVEDAIGGVSRLGVGHAGHDGPAFAVLDHDEDVTYLLADSADASDVLRALETLGVTSEHILERLSTGPDAGPEPAAQRQADNRRPVKALSHPLRVRILEILEEEPASPAELSQVLDATLGSISYHVRQLYQLGLLELVRETPRRRSVEHHYRAKPRPESGGERRGSVSAIASKAVIGAELAQTSEVAARAADAGGFESDHARLERLRLTLDAKGVEQLSKAVGKLLDEARKIQDASAKRLGTTGADVTDVALVALLFDAIGSPASKPGATSKAKARKAPRRKPQQRGAS